MNKALLKVGEIIDLEIVDINNKAEGVGFYNECLCFVPNALPEEKVRAKIRHLSKKRIIADLHTIKQPSPDRTTAPCPVYAQCGGCQLQHVTYSKQLKLKQGLISQAFQTIAQQSVSPQITASAEQFYYRNRGQYPVRKLHGEVHSGFFSARTHKLVPVTNCMIHHREINRCVQVVRGWANERGISIYDEQNHSGWLRHIVVRSNKKETLVTLVATSERKKHIPDLIKRLRKTILSLVGINISINSSKSNVIMGKGLPLLLWGRAYINEKIDNLNFQLSAHSFFQNNTAQAKQLFDDVVTGFSAKPMKILDAYCGVGVLTSMLAQHGHRMSGIEVVPQAIADAKAAAKNNALDIDYQCGTVESLLPKHISQGKHYDAVILDPPRKGCDKKVIHAIAQSQIGTVVYISCHPGSLARDCKLLFEQGYAIQRLHAFDLFPQTAHVETLCILHKQQLC